MRAKFHLNASAIQEQRSGAIVGPLVPDQELATLRRAIPWFIPASVAKSVGAGRATPDLASPCEAVWDNAVPRAAGRAGPLAAHSLTDGPDPNSARSCTGSRHLGQVTSIRTVPCRGAPGMEMRTA